MVMIFYDSLQKVTNFPKISQYIMAYYLDFVPFWYILLTFSFALGPFESLPQNFGLFQNSSKFQNFELGDGKNWKSQYGIYSFWKYDMAACMQLIMVQVILLGL
jgi:hypothetical protein